MPDRTTHTTEPPPRVGFAASLDALKPASRELALAVALHHLDVEHRRIRVHFAESLGLSASEFNALMIISDTVQIKPTDLASELGLTAGSMTALIDRLETLGLVARHANPADRRSLLITLSPGGETAKNHVYAHYLDAVSQALTDDPTIDNPATIQALEKTAAAIRRASDVPTLRP
jgi:DNA-binding MarR family transcriptional regulator